ncbi:MAG TPA: glycosyltransferase family 39 protein [Candidatus Sulfotelmatobacter sp.]|nr:glycosyltransferase family 39 protein [Candidatus Sulfotelmatobacter sp.]
MFEIAFFVGIYSYIIFLLGIAGLLYINIIYLVTFLLLLYSIYFFYKKKGLELFKYNYYSIGKSSLFILLLLFVQALVNLIGVFGPEIGFDALWYHLTLPKLYLQTHTIYHIPGGLLYYSDMPKLVEMLYLGALALWNVTLAKMIHFLFGLLTLFIIFKLSRRFVSSWLSLVAALIFYSNLVVGWESVAAYVDLARAFFEILSFYGLIVWIENKNRKYLIFSAIALGLAITTKVAGVLDLLIFIPLFIYLKREMLENILTFIFYALIVPLPWFIFSFLNTKNPIYPYFSIPVDSGHFISFSNSIFFLNFSDPISPIYLILLPLVIFSYKRFDKTERIISFFVFISFFVWLVFEGNRGTRFLLPYLPVFSVFSIILIGKFKNNFYMKFSIVLILVLSLTSIGYRLLANYKFIPYIFGKESQSQFLSRHLNFMYGDFYDIDNYFKSNIKSTDKVLLFGFHNLYYVDFPFTDSSWVKKGDKFNYIAVQNSNLPERFSGWKIVYYNSKTKVSLYSKGGKMWEY